MIDNRQSINYRNANSSGSASVPCKKDLLDRINMVSFAVNEATLFLDTHPRDQEALMYFQKYRKLRKEALEEYATLYGPLTIDCATDSSIPWNWVTEPWPWEGGNC